MKRVSTQISSSKITTLLTSISGIQFTSCSSISKTPIENLNPYINSNAYKNLSIHDFDENLDKLWGVFYQNSTINLSNGYAAAIKSPEDVMNIAPTRWVQAFSMGVGVGVQPSHTRSFSKPTDDVASEMWSSGVASKIVEKFKSSVYSDIYFVSPKDELLNCRQTIHVDGCLCTKDTFQIGLVSRLDEGRVLWARIITGRVKRLLPSAYSMINFDVNVAEMAALGFLRIVLNELGVSDFRAVSDNKLSRDYLNKAKNKFTNKSHKFLTIVLKRLWLDSPKKARVIWVEKYKNQAADGLSRAESLRISDTYIQQYYKAVEDDVLNFKERIDAEDAKEGLDVVRGSRFEELLKECMENIDDLQDGNSR